MLSTLGERNKSGSVAAFAYNDTARDYSRNEEKEREIEREIERDR